MHYTWRQKQWKNLVCDITLKILKQQQQQKTNLTHFNKPKSYRSGADSSGDSQIYGVGISGDLVGVSVAGCSWTC